MRSQPATDAVDAALRGVVLPQGRGAEDAAGDLRSELQFFFGQFLAVLACRGIRRAERGIAARIAEAEAGQQAARHGQATALLLLGGAAFLVRGDRLCFGLVGNAALVQVGAAHVALGLLRGFAVRLHLRQLRAIEAGRAQVALVEAAHARGFADPALAGATGEHAGHVGGRRGLAVGHAHLVHAHVAGSAGRHRHAIPQALLAADVHRRTLLERGDYRRLGVRGAMHVDRCLVHLRLLAGRGGGQGHDQGDDEGGECDAACESGRHVPCPRVAMAAIRGLMQEYAIRGRSRT